MNEVRLTPNDLAQREAACPGYLEELEPALRREGEAVFCDLHHPAVRRAVAHRRRCAAPGQTRLGRQNTRVRLSPGSLLAVAIAAVTGVAPCGGCIARKQQMDRWGWWGCWKRRDLIAGWLVEEAAKRGHAIGTDRATALLAAAWREVRSRRSTRG